MAIEANNPRIRRGRSRQAKPLRKAIYAKKDWINVHLPVMFENKFVGKATLLKTAKHFTGRTVDVFQSEFSKEEFANQRVFKFKINKVSGTEAYTEFSGMKVTRDLEQSIVRRNHSLIERVVDIFTQEGYQLRVLVLATTKREDGKRKAYAKRADQNETRETMNLTTKEFFESKKIDEIVKMLLDNSLGNAITQRSVLPIQNTQVIKVKVVKRPLELN